MLVTAAPRPPESQEVLPEEDVTITDTFLEPNYQELLLLDTLIDPNLIVPLSAIAARARHRQKVRTYPLVLIFQARSSSHTFLDTYKLKAGFL